MLMGWVVFSVMGGGNSTKVITPHCDVIRVTKPPLGLFVPVVSDFVEAHIQISPVLVVLHCADPQEMQWSRQGSSNPPMLFPSIRLRYNGLAGVANGEEGLVGSKILGFQDK